MNTTNINYVGTVKVSVQKDNKIISTKVFHNNGTMYLYEFLCYCLTGNFETVKNKRPFKIKLFKNEGSALPAPEPATEAINEATTFISIDQKGDVLPIIDETTNEISNYKAVFHFLIPYSFISKTEINQMCLYSATATDNDAYSAIYYLVKADGTDWDPIQITNTSSSIYNLIIEWELSFNS